MDRPGHARRRQGRRPVHRHGPRGARPDPPAALYDNGFYNIGARPTAEDPGVGGEDPFGNPLSFTRQFVRILQGAPDPFQVDPCRFEVPWLVKSPTGLPTFNSANAPFIAGLRTAVDGAFKTPTLRNIALTAPYMHGGSVA